MAPWAEEFLVRHGDEIDMIATHERLPRSDVRSARAIALHLPGEITFSDQSGTWRMWNGAVHESLTASEMQRGIQTFADAIAVALNTIKVVYQAEADRQSDKDEADKVMARYRSMWAKHRSYRDRLFSDAGQKAVVSQLKTYVGVDEERFDASPRFFVVEDGVIDLSMVMRTGEVEVAPHSPTRLVTKRSRARWDPAAEAPRWHWYLQRSLPDPEVREYLQRWCGAALLGDPKDKGLVNLIGPQDSGKSLFIKAMQLVLGDYSKMVAADTFLAKRGNGTFEAHELRGVRVALAAEPGSGKQMDEGIVKALTGGDQLQTRTLYGRFVTWTPQATIFIASNHPMKIDTADGAMLNRIKPVEFPIRFSRDPAAPPELRADLKLEEDLRGETAGILRWVVEGLLAYREHGLGVEPASVASKRETMAEEIDNPLEWLQEAIDDALVIVDPDVPAARCITVNSAYERYVHWCEAGNVKPFGRKRFSQVIQRRYPTKKSGANVFVGIRWPQILSDATPPDF